MELELRQIFPSVADTHSRQKRYSENTNKKSNVSVIITHEDLNRKVQLALNRLLCKAHCPRGDQRKKGQARSPRQTRASRTPGTTGA